MEKALGSEHLMKQKWKPSGQRGLAAAVGTHGAPLHEVVKPVPWAPGGFLLCSSVKCEDSPGGPAVKNLPANARDKDSIPGSGRQHMQLSR